MKLSKDILLLLLVLIGAAAAGMWVLNMDAQVTPAQEDSVSEEVSAQQNAPIQYSPNREGINTRGTGAQEIRQEFEKVVNGFLQDLNTRMNEYGRKRGTVREIIQPDNMRLYEYVKDNESVARTLMAELEAEQDEIVNMFATADEQMKPLLKLMNSNDAETLLREWDVTRKEQLNEYKRFFESERKLYDLYRVILEVYVESGGAYQVDLESEQDETSVNFDDAELQNTYDAAKSSAEDILNNRSVLE